MVTARVLGRISTWVAGWILTWFAARDAARLGRGFTCGTGGGFSTCRANSWGLCLYSHWKKDIFTITFLICNYGGKLRIWRGNDPNKWGLVKNLQSLDPVVDR